MHTCYELELSIFICRHSSIKCLKTLLFMLFMLARGKQKCLRYNPVNFANKFLNIEIIVNREILLYILYIFLCFVKYQWQKTLQCRVQTRVADPGGVEPDRDPTSKKKKIRIRPSRKNRIRPLNPTGHPGLDPKAWFKKDYFPFLL